MCPAPGRIGSSDGRRYLSSGLVTRRKIITVRNCAAFRDKVIDKKRVVIIEGISNFPGSWSLPMGK